MSLLKYAADPEPSADDAERRVAPRTKVLKRAKVYFNNMHSTFDCLVRNISSTGALLTLDESAHLPREFGVRIGEEKALRMAQLVYRRGMLAGIHFIDAPPAAEPARKPSAEAGALPEARSEASESDGIQRIRPACLPRALTKNLRWF